MNMSQFVIWFGAIMAVSGTAVIDPELEEAFHIGGNGSQESLIISFDADHGVVIETINGQNYSSLHEKRTALTEAQEEFANEIQGPLQKFLQSINVDHESFWINNKMYVPSASSDLVQMIANFPGVAKIEKEQIITLDPIAVGEPEYFGNETVRPEATVEWGINRIGVPKVWKKGFKGKGIVIANIDSGVRYTHVTLKGRWRKKHGWYDTYKGTRFPSDAGGHGTHTMGTIVGTHGIGVAPEATWIACKACWGGGCKVSGLIKCGEWVQCPTDYRFKNRDCKLAPELVSNSWKSGQNNNMFDSVIASWQAAGIIPVFAIGNEGDKCNKKTYARCCGSAQTPGDRNRVISVGSIDKNGRVASDSSLGPTSDKRIKPEIAAPGVNIRSAGHTSDTAYVPMSGTSMACPHVAGVVALMRQKSKHVSYTKVYKAIISTARRDNLRHTKLPKCGDISSSKFPNNIYGYGEISAEKAVAAV